MMLRPLLWIFSCYFLVHPLALAATANNSKVASPPLKSSMENALADKNLASGKLFLEENQKKPGIHVLPSGLQYKIIQEGTGNPPGPTDFVIVNYRGTLIDGTEFDSSYAHHSPVTLAINAIIPGWAEALQMMKPGAKWTIYVPPNLAYGKEGVGQIIGPNTVLIFDIELLSTKASLDEDQSSLNDVIEDEG